MPDHYSDETEVSLAFRALLYASGEMDPAEAAAFEARLGEDQAAREALCQAVQVAHAGLQPLRPDPAYRERVRQRVQQRPGLWRWLTGRRFYRGHPLAWSGLGAAAAVLLMLGGRGDSPSARPDPARPEVAAKPARKARAEPRKPGPSLPPAPTSAEARAWAELQSSMAYRKRWLSHLSIKH
jgi:hypothetical protein